MLKFIYPISSNIWKKRSAWKRLHRIEEDYELCMIRPKVREETFESESIFVNIDDGVAFRDRRRVFTFTFFLEPEQAAEFLAKLCTPRQKLARLLHGSTVLLLLDDELPALAP